MNRDSLRLSITRLLSVLVSEVWNSCPPAVRAVDTDIVYASHDRQRLTLDVFHPEGDPPYPVLMMIHGGGFVTGDKRLLERHCRFFAHHGFLCVNVNYRLAPEYHYPAPIEDVAVALQWVKANVDRFGGDPSRICVGGGSAGAYLAAMLAIRASGGRYTLESGDASTVDGSFQALLLWNGVFDLVTTQRSSFPQAAWICRSFIGGAGRPTESDLLAASPISHVREGFAPTLIITGEKDPLSGESQAMRDTLAVHDVAHEYRSYAGSNHGFFNWYWTRNAKTCLADTLAFLRRELGEPIPNPSA